MGYDGPCEVNKDIHTERRIPTPAKMTLAGENTCHVNMRKQISERACRQTYQANARSKNVRESIHDVDGRIKPFCPSFVGTPGLI
jgi:hypothetical protein